MTVRAWRDTKDQQEIDHKLISVSGAFSISDNSTGFLRLNVKVAVADMVLGNHKNSRITTLKTGHNFVYFI